MARTSKKRRSCDFLLPQEFSWPRARPERKNSDPLSRHPRGPHFESRVTPRIRADRALQVSTRRPRLPLMLVEERKKCYEVRRGKSSDPIPPARRPPSPRAFTSSPAWTCRPRRPADPSTPFVRAGPGRVFRLLRRQRRATHEARPSKGVRESLPPSWVKHFDKKREEDEKLRRLLETRDAATPAASSKAA